MYPEDLQLNDQERDLILLIRHKYRFGEITVITHEGLPKQVLKTIERKLLGNLSPNEFDEN